jgi:gentisate 1,2-dioxygenase
MHLPKHEIPVKIGAPGATARQLSDFGTATGTLGAEYFSLGAGADIAPLLEGLEHDLCASAHWGYMISGAVTVTYRDGTSESCSGGDVFYWPSWHTVRAEQDAEIILFSPQDDHLPVMEHIKAKMGV